MLQVSTEDVTVPWGRAPDPLDVQTGRYRMAVFQDVVESIDKKLLYFLYDPVADEQSGTSGGRKGGPGIVVFDVNRRCFTQEIPLYVNSGNLKFLFGLKCPSSAGGTSAIVVTDGGEYNQSGVRITLWLLFFFQLHLWKLITLREDAPELVVLSGPGLNVTRINCLSDYPSSPVGSFSVPGADIAHFYDAFVSRGKIYFVSSSPDGHFDNTRVHFLSLEGDTSIRTEHCKPDPQRGMPSARKQKSLGFLLLAGGEIDYGDSVVRLVDYWVLSLESFTWMQIPAQMPIPLIEPRLTANSTGTVYLWGDFDQPLPGMPAGTHLRILRLSGINMNPPAYEDALKQPKVAPISSLYPSTGSGLNTPYPDPQGGPGINQAQPPPYGMQTSGVPTPYPQQGFGGPGQQGMQPTPPGPMPPSGYPQQYPPPQQPGYPQQPQPGYPQQPPQPGYPQQPPQPGYQSAQYPQAPQAPVGQYAHYPPEEKKECVVQ
ncbi:unnamed protein product [Enterobius vermicularis]|uniref:Kelch repeat protein n=1 Tax=Enterobius vermicularis TaxID=51028 RepID=A0A0N4USH6_ENTVE|nr:unnamed protein product [Enterobius vermicularis]